MKNQSTLTAEQRKEIMENIEFIEARVADLKAKLALIHDNNFLKLITEDEEKISNLKSKLES